jgi:hypothetical protein
MRKTKIKYSDTTFWGLLRIVGIKEFLNFSLFFSIVISLFFWKIILPEYGANTFILIKISSPILLSSAATIFGISLAALSVTISVFYKPILPAMLETKLLHKYLFPFWKTVALWGIVIIITFFLMIVTNLEINDIPIIGSDIAFIIVIFLFTYSVFYTIRLRSLREKNATLRKQ